MIKLFTDSASDFSKEEALKYDVNVIPLKVRIGDVDYLDGYDITSREFFNKLIENTELPKTSQLTTYDYEQRFKDVDSNDDILVITLSSDLSGTYKSAMLVAKEDKRVYVVDSKNATIGQKLLVKRARALINQGLDVKTIVDILEEEKKEIRLIALVDTLEYLKKGGRISAATAFIGGILNIKPVIELKDGKVVSTGKARGSKAGNNKLREGIANYNGIDFKRPYEVAYSGLSSELLLKYLEDSKDLYGDRIVPISTIGSIIGTHVGPGAIAVAFFNKK